MAKKVNVTFEADLIKNTQKGGAWLAEYSVIDTGMDKAHVAGINAFSNPSAGKRWLKEQVLAHTNKKSIKMIATEDKDEKGKPIHFTGVVAFKREV
jgi:hypothetical protein